MPTLYSTPDAFRTSAPGRACGADVPDDDAVLTQDLATVSDDVRTRLGRDVVAPPTTTLTQLETVGTTTLHVANCFNIHQGDVAHIGADTYRVVDAQPVALMGLTYPGTLYLETATTTQYADATPVTIWREDRSVYGGLYGPLRLTNWPILSLEAVYQTFWDGVEAPASTVGWMTDTAQSHLYFPRNWAWDAMSTKVTFRIQYRAGYLTVPSVIRHAVHLLTAAEIMRVQNPLGGSSVSQSGDSVSDVGKLYRADAEVLLEDWMDQPGVIVA